VVLLEAVGRRPVGGFTILAFIWKESASVRLLVVVLRSNSHTHLEGSRPEGTGQIRQAP
jgi:hypothetical protein